MQPEFKRALASANAPMGRGPFPQAMAAGPFVFVSGQGPLSPETNLPIGGSFAGQVRQTFANVEAILGAAGLGLEHVVKVTVYLSDISNVPEFNRLYAELMPTPHPARTLVQVGLRGIDVEIDAIAAMPGIADAHAGAPREA
jgi:2-iminobutanoate/2-iminopropanoate deaminase